MMTRRLDDDDESILPERPARLTSERELTLGTGAILAIFFGLVVLCGAFFGFGYKLGNSAAKSAGVSTAAESAEPSASASTNFNSFNKPNAGSPVGETNGGTAQGIAVRGGAPVLTAPPGAPASNRANSPAATPSAPATESETPASTASVPVAHTTPAAAPASVPSAAMPTTSPGGAFVVQVAAVSHQEDADLLVTALHAKGYAVAARSEPGDKLVHIQVGPFKDKPTADAMRQRLLADGYNAFIK